MEAFRDRLTKHLPADFGDFLRKTRENCVWPADFAQFLKDRRENYKVTKILKYCGVVLGLFLVFVVSIQVDRSLAVSNEPRNIVWDATDTSDNLPDGRFVYVFGNISAPDLSPHLPEVLRPLVGPFNGTQLNWTLSMYVKDTSGNWVWTSNPEFDTDSDVQWPENVQSGSTTVDQGVVLTGHTSKMGQKGWLSCYFWYLLQHIQMAAPIQEELLANDPHYELDVGLIRQIGATEPWRGVAHTPTRSWPGKGNLSPDMLSVKDSVPSTCASDGNCPYMELTTVGPGGVAREGSLNIAIQGHMTPNATVCAWLSHENLLGMAVTHAINIFGDRSPRKSWLFPGDLDRLMFKNQFPPMNLFFPITVRLLLVCFTILCVEWYFKFDRHREEMIIDAVDQAVSFEVNKGSLRKAGLVVGIVIYTCMWLDSWLLARHSVLGIIWGILFLLVSGVSLLYLEYKSAAKSPDYEELLE